ncbi:MAG: DNA primase [Clostridia bacterium]|nr:DNA primase [Clostridia bacterium]
MAISDDFLTELRSRVDTEDVISSYINLKRRGKNLIGLCPFHNEKTPSFTVYPENGSFYCFGCGAGGDMVTFIRRIENLDYVEAVKLLADRVGMKMPEDGYDDTLSRKRQRIHEANREAARFFHTQLLKSENEFALSYFTKDRALSMNTVRHFGLGFAPNSWNMLLNHLQSKGFSLSEMYEANLIRKSEKENGGYYDAFRNRVVIPIIGVRGNIIGFGARVLDDTKPKYLNTNDTLVYKKSKEVFALNFAKSSGERRLILCEGYMDVISLHQAGFTYAVAGCGTALTQEQAQLISRYADEVILSYDSDEAGQKALQKAISIFSQLGLKIKVLELKGGKDPDDIIRKYGKERFKALIDGAANDLEFRILAEKEKYDITSDDGKVRFLTAVVDILSREENPIEREVYVSRIANELSVDKTAINLQLKQTIEKRRRAVEKTKFGEMQKSLRFQKDEINPEKRDNIRAAKAEEAIITLLMNNNEFYNSLKNELSEDLFVTDFNRRVFSAVINRLKDGKFVDIEHISGMFNPAEVGRITQMYMNRKAFLNTVEECRDCIAVLHREKEAKALKNQNFDDDSEWLKSFESLKERKQ